MIYSNYDINLRATARFTVICKYLCKHRLITVAAVHRKWNDCSTDFGKFPRKTAVKSYFSRVTGLAILLKY